MKSRSTAILLAILFGFFGVHRFYLNRPGSGILYFLFAWTFIPMIIGWLEAIAMLSMSQERFTKHYGLEPQVSAADLRMAELQLEIERLKNKVG